MARQTDVVFLAATAFGDWDNVIELDLVVFKVNSAVLTRVIVSTNNPHLHLEWDISPRATKFRCLRKAFRRVSHGTDVSKHRALHLRDHVWY